MTGMPTSVAMTSGAARRIQRHGPVLGREDLRYARALSADVHYCTGGPRAEGRLRCANWYSRARAQPSILTAMTCCAYCGQPATMKIVSNPQDVCFEHALEFWTGLLLYARDRSEPCVKRERLCTCRSCEELSMSSRRAIAIAAAGPSPRDGERFRIRLAS